MTWSTKSWGGFCVGAATVVVRAGGKNGDPGIGSASGAKPIVTIPTVVIKLAIGTPVA